MFVNGGGACEVDQCGLVTANMIGALMKQYPRLELMHGGVYNRRLAFTYML
jgi:hypothetical protein